MRTTAMLLAAAALVFAAQGGRTAAGDEQTLTGTYLWEGRGSSGDLQAVFTPTGEAAWDVAFHFTFRGKPHTYSGTAEGNLSDGALKGKVFNEDRKRTFTFSGEFRDGEFEGTHAEIEGGKESRTGTLVLAR